MSEDTPLFGVSSKLGKATARALQAKETATNSIAEVIDASFNFGWEAGATDNNYKALEIIALEMNEWAAGTTGRAILERLAERIALLTKED